MLKIILYIVITVLVIFSLDSLDINRFFKSRKPFQAKLLLFFIAVALTYLITAFCYDIITISKII